MDRLDLDFENEDHRQYRVNGEKLTNKAFTAMTTSLSQPPFHSVKTLLSHFQSYVANYDSI